jgi:hypothetical protein
MAKGFEIETALGAPFSLAKRRPVSVFVWGLLSFLPVLPLIPLMMPIWVEALKPGVSDNMMIGQILAANLGAQLVQVLQWVAAIFVIAAASRAVLVEPRMRANRFFFLGFGMAELMVAVIYIAFLIGVGAIACLLALIGLGLGFAVWSVGAPWNWLAMGLYTLACFAGVIWLALRLSLMMAASVDRQTLAIEAAWRATKGQSLRLLLLCFLIWISSIAVSLIFVAVTAPVGFGVFFLSGLRFEMFGHGAPLPVLTPASVAILAVAGAAFAIALCWFTGLYQALWASPFASVWKQMEARAAAKAADAAARDALGSPEL